MRTPPSYLYSIGRFLLFVLIETGAILLVSNNENIQRLSINESLREASLFFGKQCNSIKDYFSLKAANSEIMAQNAALLAENERFRTFLKIEQGDSIVRYLNERLADSAKGFSYLCAQVVKNSGVSSTHNYLIINKGYKDGVTEDMGVITPSGVVGIIRSASAHHSLVISFLNTKQQVSAKLGRSNMFGPLSWNGFLDNRATLNEIPQHIDVTPGDTVYTSGYSSIFPANIPLGRVESSKIINGMHKSVTVELFQNYRLLDNVIVAQNKNVEEIENLSERAIEIFSK